MDLPAHLLGHGVTWIPSPGTAQVYFESILQQGKMITDLMLNNGKIQAIEQRKPTALAIKE